MSNDESKLPIGIPYDTISFTLFDSIPGASLMVPFTLFDSIPGASLMVPGVSTIGHGEISIIRILCAPYSSTSVLIILSTAIFLVHAKLQKGL